MKYLVIDVAAEYGGAVTVLEQFIEEFEQSLQNEYVIVVSKTNYHDRKNVRFICENWVKKSHIHRLYFDNVYVNKIVKEVNPDVIFSLQNKTVRVKGIRQEVFFHNALPISDKKFSLFESRSLWIYQNIIGRIVKRSLFRADKIYVQANWIKRTLVDKWNLKKEIIEVKKPIFSSYFRVNSFRDKLTSQCILFYPSNSAIYKNHIILLKSILILKSKTKDENNIELVLTCKLEDLNKDCIDIINKNKLKVIFTGRLTREEMKNWYSKSILVFPSYLETVGLPLAEAKDMNCIVLVADCEYAHETLGDYKNALYFDPFSENELAKLILECQDIK